MTVRGREHKAELQALAAAWLTRIHSDRVGPADIAAFQAWLAEDPSHREVFAAVTNVWEAAGGLRRDVAAHQSPSRLGGKTIARRAVLASCAVLIGLTVFALSRDFSPVEQHSTEVGQQLRLPLPDGSQAMLDSDTIIRVEFDRNSRVIELVRGRTFLDVAHDRARPLVVRAGARQVVALGTAFDVERAADGMGVVLIRGRIAVEPTEKKADSQAVELDMPGEFASLMANGRMVVGQIDLGKATAWQSGRIVFDDESLSSAVAQLNRYSRRPLVLADPTLGQLHVSGTYGIGNADSFATSLSLLLPVTAAFERERIVLMRKARPK